MTSAIDTSMDNSVIQNKLIDYSEVAKTVKLCYISGNQPGIERIKEGDSFIYFYKGERITDEKTLNRIKSLVIPPAWENVWICPKENGHIQATGIDKLNRKQYRYHASWNEVSSVTKYHRLFDFGMAIPQIRKHIKKDLSLPGYPKEKVLAAVVSLLEQTHIRIGNSFYEKLYGSFGLTTLKNRHVKLDSSQICFSFKGKKGVYHNISLKSLKLARIIKGCKEIPGKDLFNYIDDTGNANTIHSGMVNEYIHDISGQNFTAKDFRTWAGSLIALTEFMNIGGYNTETERKHNIVKVIDIVAEKLGNTRTVCRKYYIHPEVIKSYEDNTLSSIIKKANRKNVAFINDEMTSEEKALLYLLKNSKS